MSRRDAYVDKVKAKLDELNASIDKLEARARGASADARLEYEEQAAALKRESREVRSKLDALRAAGDDAWEDLKDGVDGAWRTLESAMRSAASRFK